MVNLLKSITVYILLLVFLLIIANCGVEDATPPDTSITSQPLNLTNSTSATFNFTSTEGGSTFECQIDSGGYTTCTSPKEYIGLTEKSHTFEVRAIDTANNTDQTPASYTWAIDTTAVEISITSQPSNPTNSTSANFSFTSTETATFECQIDSGGYTTCTSPKEYTGLIEGSHTFEIKATDAAGNTNSTPASYTWTIDTTAPDTSITVSPSNLTNSTSASFSFTSTETATFECQIDSGGYTTCTSPKEYIGLTEKSHTFEVRAIDSAGNVDSTPASYTWTIDTTAPDTNITVSPSNLTNSTSANFSFTSEMGSTFECKIDNDSYTTCTSPKEYPGLAEGSHTFNVKATDTANNTDPTSASYAWTIDTTAPTGSISINNGVTYTSSTSVTLTLSASDISGVATMQFSNDNTNWSTAETYATSKEWILSTGEDGTRTVYVKFKDNLGNWTITPATDSITLDTKPPTGTISINSGATYTNSVSVTLTLSCTDSSSGCSQMQFSNDNSTWSTAETYSTSKTWTLSTGDGTKTVYVKFKDNAGNWTTTTISDSITLDTTPPEVSSTSPANNDTGVAINTSITATFSEIMDESTITTATFTIAGVIGAVTYSDTIATFKPSSNLTTNTTYTTTITTGVKDAAGNAMANNKTWSFKTVDAILSWTPPTTRMNETTLLLSEISTYRVYYGTSSGVYTLTKDVAASSCSSTCSTTISGLSPGRYYFAVTAFDTTSPTPNESGYSNEMSKTIP